MPVASVRALKVGLIGWLMTSSLLLSAGTSAGLSIGGFPPQITVAVSNGFLYSHYTTAGFPVAIDVMLLAKDATPPFASDVYVGILSPDGQSTSLLADPQAPAFPFLSVPRLVTGPPVPFLSNVVLAADSGGRLEIQSFAAGEPDGWYMVYGLIVAAGKDPGDPRQWIGSSFFPIRVVPPTNQ